MIRPITGNEVKQLRDGELAGCLGRHVSQRELGLALGLQPDSAARRVRKWEQGDESISGPMTLALEFLRFATGYPEVFNRYWRDRFR